MSLTVLNMSCETCCSLFREETSSVVIFIEATGRLMLQRTAKKENCQRPEKPWNTDTLLNRLKFKILRKYVRAMTTSSRLWQEKISQKLQAEWKRNESDCDVNVAFIMRYN